MTEEPKLVVYQAEDATNQSKLPTPLIILKSVASNYTAWRRILEFLLRAQPCVWDVTSGSLKPDGNTANFDKGNRTAANLLICSAGPTIVTIAFEGVDL